MATSSIVQEYLKKADEKEDFWSFSNNVLYDLCKKNPKHDKDDVNIAKIWLIGRSYAAAIERGAENQSVYFYEEIIAPAVKKYASKIDNAIATLSKNAELHTIFTAYDIVFKCFHEISGKRNTSLASKYLHFHCPDLFYMYDSRAVSAIGLVLEDYSLGKSITSADLKPFAEFGESREYIRFYLKCQKCVEAIEKDIGKKFTPREFDNLLLTIADERRVAKDKLTK